MRIVVKIIGCYCEVEGDVVDVEVEGGNVGPLLDGIIHGKR